MSRFVKLDQVDVTLEIVDPATKADVAVAYAGVDKEGRFSFDVPAYDPTAFHTLDAIHVGLYDTPADGSPAAVPDDPSQVVDAANHFSSSCDALMSGGTVVVDATDAPEGKYTSLLVLEFAE